MKNFKIILSALLGIVFLYISFKGIDFITPFKIAIKANVLLLILAVFMHCINQAVRAERFRILLNEPEFKFSDAYKVFWVGLLANYILPARLGEFVRPAVMKKVYKTGFSRVLGAVFVERLFELSGQMTLFLFVALFINLPQYVKTAGIMVFCIYCISLTVIFLFNKKKNFFINLINFIFSKFPDFASKIIHFFTYFIEGASVIKDFKTFFKVFIFTIIAWGTSIFNIMMTVMALGLFLPQPFISASFIQAAISVALVLPPPPGFIGTFHYFCKIGLEFFGITAETAMSFGILLHFMHMIITIAAGTLALMSLKLSFKNILNKEE